MTHAAASLDPTLSVLGQRVHSSHLNASPPSLLSSPQSVLVWRGRSGHQLAHPGAGAGRLSGKCLSPSQRRLDAAAAVRGTAAHLQ